VVVDVGVDGGGAALAFGCATAMQQRMATKKNWNKGDAVRIFNLAVPQKQLSVGSGQLSKALELVARMIRKQSRNSLRG
jgi:hypothetical protein